MGAGRHLTGEIAMPGMNNVPHFGGLLRNYVAGEFSSTDKTFENISPIDGSLINCVSEADRVTVDQAVKAARGAVQGDWGKLSVYQRADLMYQVADGIERRFEDFVAAEMADTGKSLFQARTIDIPRGAANFRVFADLSKSRAGESFQTGTASGDRALNYSIYKPLGVVVVIAPWNLPLLLLTWKLAPAMAVGNAVIAKPSEETRATATLLAEVMDQVGIPAGAFNLAHGFGLESAEEFLTSHPGIDAVTFTGESSTGGD